MKILVGLILLLSLISCGKNAVIVPYVKVRCIFQDATGRYRLSTEGYLVTETTVSFKLYNNGYNWYDKIKCIYIRIGMYGEMNK